MGDAPEPAEFLAYEDKILELEEELEWWIAKADYLARVGKRLVVKKNHEDRAILLRLCNEIIDKTKGTK
jgi:hypothetical protein